MLSFILGFDTRATQFINELIPHNKIFDKFFSFFSMIGSTAFIWIAIVFFLIVFEEKRNHRFIISFAISILVTGIFVNVIIKNIVQRPRPQFLTSRFVIQTNQCPKDFSFPSGHASAAFASAAVIACYDKKRRWFYYLVAVLISLSRIYLNCHYFLDVVIGGGIGHIISMFILRFNFRVSRRRR